VSRPADHVFTHSGPQGKPSSGYSRGDPDKADIQVINIKCLPRVFAAAESESVGGMLKAIVGRAPLVTIKPNECADFPLVSIGSTENFDNLKPWRPLIFAIFWRRSSSPWLPQPPKLITLSMRYLRRLQAAAK
jgi:hypothetical protein